MMNLTKYASAMLLFAIQNKMMQILVMMTKLVKSIQMTSRLKVKRISQLTISVAANI